MGALQIFVSNGALRSRLWSYLRRLLQDEGVHVLLKVSCGGDALQDHGTCRSPWDHVGR
jgi:hypothetical protein